MKMIKEARQTAFQLKAKYKDLYKFVVLTQATRHGP